MVDKIDRSNSVPATVILGLKCERVFPLRIQDDADDRGQIFDVNPTEICKNKSLADLLGKLGVTGFEIRDNHVPIVVTPVTEDGERITREECALLELVQAGLGRNLTPVYRQVASHPVELVQYNGAQPVPAIELMSYDFAPRGSLSY